MFEHYALGTRVNTLRQGSSEEQLLSPRDMPQGREQPSGRQRQQQCPSPPLSATSPSASAPESRHNSNPTPDTIDSLAQELSKQKLQLDEANLAKHECQLSSPFPSPDLLAMSPIMPCPDLEIDDEPQLDLASLLGRHNALAFSSALAESSTAMELEEPAPVVPDIMRLRRQQSSHFHNNPSNSRSIQNLVESMISSGSQCTVHRVSPPPVTPTSATRLEPILEPDDDNKVAIAGMDLEVDEAYMNGSSSCDAEKEEKFLLESLVSLRRAGTPAGVRKAWSALPFRTSADAALRSPNVVRARPRMRRRRRPGNNSKGSSAVSSVFSSPVIPPSLPDESTIPCRRV